MHFFIKFCLNAFIVYSSMLIMLTFFSPIGFESAYARYAGKNQNGTINGDQSGWPLKMQLRSTIASLLCEIPSPNYDVTDDQLTAAWQLPQRTRLSPTMRDIGRCKLAAKRLRTEAGIAVDDAKCNCVNILWPLFVLAIATLTLLRYCLCACACFGSKREGGGGRGVKLAQLRDDRFAAGCWTVVWYLAMGIYMTRHVDAGVSYTIYGDMYPQIYYQHEPSTWFCLFLLCMINCAAEGAKFLFYWSAIRETKTRCGENETRRRRETGTNATRNVGPKGADHPPPPYETLNQKKQPKKPASV